MRKNGFSIYFSSAYTTERLRIIIYWSEQRIYIKSSKSCGNNCEPCGGGNTTTTKMLIVDAAPMTCALKNVMFNSLHIVCSIIHIYILSRIASRRQMASGCCRVFGFCFAYWFLTPFLYKEALAIYLLFADKPF